MSAYSPSGFDGWNEVVGLLEDLVDLEGTARSTKALQRRRGVASAGALLRLALAWSAGGLSLRGGAGWAGANDVAELGDAALLRRLRKSADWLEHLTQTVLAARAPLANSLGLQGRLIRLVDGSTFGVQGSAKPGWRLHAGFDLPTEQLGAMTLTSAAEGEGLELIAVTPGEVRIADRGFARPDGLRHVVVHGGDFLVRIGSRSLKLEITNKAPFDLSAACAIAARDGIYDQQVFVLHSRFGRQRWRPLPVRLIIKPLPPEAAEAARRRVKRAGQRESYAPSAQTFLAAGHVMLVTSLQPEQATADELLDIYRLRWQIELAFKRIKSLLDMRVVPTKDPALARTWLHANLLVFLLAETYGADIAESSPSEA